MGCNYLGSLGRVITNRVMSINCSNAQETKDSTGAFFCTYLSSLCNIITKNIVSIILMPQEPRQVQELIAALNHGSLGGVITNWSVSF